MKSKTSAAPSVFAIMAMLASSSVSAQSAAIELNTTNAASGVLGATAIPITPAKPDAVELDAVVVKSANNRNERRDSTASKIIVTGEDLMRHGDASVAEALGRVPGVTVSGNAGRGGKIRMRGLGNGYTQILLNGEPTGAGFSIDSIAPGQIERIEIKRTATADQSAQAIAGTINIILNECGAPGATASEDCRFRRTRIPLGEYRRTIFGSRRCAELYPGRQFEQPEICHALHHTTAGARCAGSINLAAGDRQHRGL